MSRIGYNSGDIVLFVLLFGGFDNSEVPFIKKSNEKAGYVTSESFSFSIPDNTANW